MGVKHLGRNAIGSALMKYLVEGVCWSNQVDHCLFPTLGAPKVTIYTFWNIPDLAIST